MSLASLANVPNSPETQAAWSFSHMAHHRDINRRIYEVFKVALPEYLLDPFDPRETGILMQQHQIMHTNQNAILKISGNNLLDVNWLDDGERSEWIWLDWIEHKAAGDILGV
jgi:hypothetical protein